MPHMNFSAGGWRMAWLACAALAGCAWGTAQAQDRIYRCGNEYTNNPTPAQKKDCTPLEGGNVTVVQGTRATGGKASGGNAKSSSVASADQPRVDPAVQKARDSDARAILEAELRRAEARLLEVQREYNGGQPERRGVELRNPALYNERIADLKASLARAEADVAGIRRELQRVGGAATPAASSAQAAAGNAPAPR